MAWIKKVGQMLKEFEDYLVPVLGLKPGERAVYMHLLRHSRLEGRRGVVVTMHQLGRGVCLTDYSVRHHLFALARKGCVRVKRWRRRNIIEVLLPAEVLLALTPQSWTRLAGRTARHSRNPVIREAILRRERGRCFYCLKKLKRGELWFDHVVPLSRGGWPAEDNVVACCVRCNQRKGTRPAEELLQRLRREGVLTRRQVAERKRALAALLKAEEMAA